LIDKHGRKDLQIRNAWVRGFESPSGNKKPVEAITCVTPIVLRT
jgi:hypothetical protein